VILYARTSKALSRLTNLFRLRDIQKTYWAVVRPGPDLSEGHIVNYLEKNERINKSFTYSQDGPGRKQSELTYNVIGRSDHYSFVEVKPKTGRHHQIRTTLSSLGSPIKGDIKYGARRTNDNASIHLHARRIEFVHPVKKEPISILAPPPEDPLWNEWLRVENDLV
jgi:23S rRNA pseudouridine1911/1915/1917 synthase